MAKWTPERVEILTSMWIDGCTGQEIGNVLGLTRDAVLGRVRRLGLPSRPKPIFAPKTKPRVRQQTPEPMPIRTYSLNGVTLWRLSIQDRTFDRVDWFYGAKSDDRGHGRAKAASQGRPD